MYSHETDLIRGGYICENKEGRNLFHLLKKLTSKAGKRSFLKKLRNLGKNIAERFDKDI